MLAGLYMALAAIEGRGNVRYCNTIISSVFHEQFITCLILNSTNFSIDQTQVWNAYLF